MHDQGPLVQNFIKISPAVDYLYYSTANLTYSKLHKLSNKKLHLVQKYFVSLHFLFKIFIRAY